jgi:hypothetical protein
MGQKFNKSELYEDQSVTITYEGQEMTWVGDYEIRSWGEEPDWDYPGDCESEVEILETEYIEAWSEKEENWVNIEPTPSILMYVQWEIEKKI